mmetsp:Transcript_6877/g.23446  ORF Transcript_6877/g.23446 Transcript_6877/m.23446 type:complete len:230 (-) Transcript_6877:292-981(-)
MHPVRRAVVADGARGPAQVGVGVLHDLGVPRGPPVHHAHPYPRRDAEVARPVGGRLREGGAVHVHVEGGQGRVGARGEEARRGGIEGHLELRGDPGDAVHARLGLDELEEAVGRELVAVARAAAGAAATRVCAPQVAQRLWVDQHAAVEELDGVLVHPEAVPEQQGVRLRVREGVGLHVVRRGAHHRRDQLAPNCLEAAGGEECAHEALGPLVGALPGRGNINIGRDLL